MPDIKWIKVAVDMFEDSKIEFIRSLPEGDSIIVTWIQMLSIAGKSNSNGYLMVMEGIPYTEQLLCNTLRRNPVFMQFALQTLSNLKMINLDDGPFHITNWEKHQSVEKMGKIKSDGAIRQARYRENLKNRSLLLEKGDESDVTSDVTNRHSNAQEVDIDLELNISTTTDDFESLEKVHLSIFGGSFIAPLWSRTYQSIRDKGYTNGFILELIQEAAESSSGKITPRFVDSIFERWTSHGISSRKEAKEGRPPRGTSKVGRTGQASHHRDPELEARRMEIARTKWIQEGNDPDEFVYRPASGT